MFRSNSKFILVIALFSLLLSCIDNSQDNISNSKTNNNNSKINSKINSIDVNIFRLSKNNSNQKVGTVTFQDGSKGLLIKTNLYNIEPGAHGFHIHTNPSCMPLEKNGELIIGLAAGGHYDPKGTNKHLGPEDIDGHLGDLPVLLVEKNGKSVKELLAPRLKLADLIGRSVMIHAHGDNYSDTPKPLGGGGARKYCGVI